jgi:SAM-dependent methyltransferase
LGQDGREDPDSGDSRLWRQRLESLAAARTSLASTRPSGERPVVIDVGSGGGWASRYLGDADVIALDLIDVAGETGALHVRGDMRSLPLRDRCANAALYVASLHYAPLVEAIPEAARVLRPGGVMVAVDSPMYRDHRGQARARKRSAVYYAGAGFPELAGHYHPIAVPELLSALETSGFEVLRLDGGSTAGRWYERAGRRRASFLLARTKPS